ncbi:unnamed protein product [Gongylonema pulchrum]|uniref:Uncharacterized protein n=1 Tax=Gongylonema pulchrum TaxID=637853 RepID=A0A183E9X2_9BILA|nr:unnamed protein product [Gongylonema pulchrum]
MLKDVPVESMKVASQNIAKNNPVSSTTESLEGNVSARSMESVALEDVHEESSGGDQTAKSAFQLLPEFNGLTGSEPQSKFKMSTAYTIPHAPLEMSKTVTADVHFSNPESDIQEEPYTAHAISSSPPERNDTDELSNDTLASNSRDFPKQSVKAKPSEEKIGQITRLKNMPNECASLDDGADESEIEDDSYRKFTETEVGFAQPKLSTHGRQTDDAQNASTIRTFTEDIEHCKAKTEETNNVTATKPGNTFGEQNQNVGEFKASRMYTSDISSSSSSIDDEHTDNTEFTTPENATNYKDYTYGIGKAGFSEHKTLHAKNLMGNVTANSKPTAGTGRKLEQGTVVNEMFTDDEFNERLI